jgi:hypothetical protein
MLKCQNTAIQLTTLHTICNSLHEEASAESKTKLKCDSIIASVRACAQSGDEFVYMACVYILGNFELALPTFKPKREAESLVQEERSHLVRNWSTEQVCSWVKEHPFKQYHQVFRDSFVDGRVLLSFLDPQEDAAEGAPPQGDKDMIEMDKVGLATRPLHRKCILQAIQALKSSEGETGTLVRKPKSRAAAGPSYDVFISYRRETGADFAQLLKLQLKERGLEVFLDVENLGTGDFSEALKSSLKNSKNVILVWTQGCMDRLKEPSDVRSTLRCWPLTRTLSPALPHPLHLSH